MCGTHATATSTSGTFDTMFEPTTTSATNARSPSAIAARDHRRDRVEQRDRARRRARRRRRRRTARAKNSEQRPVDARERAARAARATRPSAPRPRTSRRPRARRRRARARRTARARASAFAVSTRRARASAASDRRAARRQLAAEQPARAAPAFAARHATPTGSVSTRYCAKPIVPCAAAPTIMFCGLPRKLTTPPTFAADASASRYGSAGSRASTTTATTSGVSTTHTVSLSSSADSAPATNDQPEQQRARRARAGQHEVRREPEELRLLEVRGDHEHAEQQDDDVQIDRVRARRPSAARRPRTIATAPTIAPAGRSSPTNCELAARDDQVGHAKTTSAPVTTPHDTPATPGVTTACAPVIGCERSVRARACADAHAPLARHPCPSLSTSASSSRSVRRRRLAARHARGRQARPISIGVVPPPAAGRRGRSSAGEARPGSEHKKPHDRSHEPRRRRRRDSGEARRRRRRSPARATAPATGSGSRRRLGLGRRHRRGARPCGDAPAPSRRPAERRDRRRRQMRRADRARRACGSPARPQIQPPDVVEDRDGARRQAAGDARRSRSASTRPATSRSVAHAQVVGLRRLRRSARRGHRDAGATGRTRSTATADPGLRRRDVRLHDQVDLAAARARARASTSATCAKTYRTPFRRKKVEALRGVTFAVERGHIFGFVGPNGAGKTTTIRTLMGLIRPTGGTRDDPRPRDPEPRRARARSASCPSRRTSTTT